MNRAIELVRLRSLMERTTGRPEVKVGLVDGVVEARHPALANARIRALRPPRCRHPGSPGCRHGTFLAGMLMGSGALGLRGLCPGATLLASPIFADEEPDDAFATPQEVADAIHQLIDAGATVINLSAGIASGSVNRMEAVVEACSRAQAQGVLMVAAAGNQSRLGPVPLSLHDWVIPVASCLEDGTVDLRSNLGPGVGRRGLLAPGFEIRGALAPASTGLMRGTSVAAVFVTGTIALLRALHPTLSASRLRQAVLASGGSRRNSIVPPLLDARRALDSLPQP